MGKEGICGKPKMVSEMFLHSGKSLGAGAVAQLAEHVLMAWRGMSVIVAKRRESHENRKFQAILCYTVSSRPAWATRNPVSNRGNI